MSMKKLFKEYDALSGLPLKLLAYETRKAIKNRIAELRDAILDEAGEIEERILELASNCNELHDELENERERDQESGDGTLVEELKAENKKVKAELSKALEELGSRDYRDEQKVNRFMSGTATISGVLIPEREAERAYVSMVAQNPCGLPQHNAHPADYLEGSKAARLEITWTAREV